MWENLEPSNWAEMIPGGSRGGKLLLSQRASPAGTPPALPFVLQFSVRNEVMATSHGTDEWMTQMEISGLNSYIVRRYIATPNGVLRIYPGSLMDKAFDPTRRQWSVFRVPSAQLWIISEGQRRGMLRVGFGFELISSPVGLSFCWFFCFFF